MTDFTPAPEAPAPPPRFAAVVACPCGVDVPVTADQGAHAITCFSCGDTMTVVVGDAAPVTPHTSEAL